MNPSVAQLFAAVESGVVYVRVVGRATFAAGVDFRALLEKVIQQGHRRIAIDLRECPLMDSTFIGLLTTFGMQLPPQGGEGISLHHVNERVRGLLTNLGVGHLFLECVSNDGIPENLATTPAGGGGASEVELQRTCLEAHLKLMEANPENIARFKDVTRFLAEDLKKAESAART
jgi:anti-anti-sigma regulatory factor